MKNKLRFVLTLAVILLWLGLSFFAWGKESTDVSESERRKLAQFPTLSAETLSNGKFMTGFESYTLDQFPLRDTFRMVKSWFHYNVLRQGDNNDIYIADGYAAKLEYPLNEASVSGAVSKFDSLYELYLKDSGSRITFAMVPDKGCYLAQENGYPAMDYEALRLQLEGELPWANHVNLIPTLEAGDYYRTDTHWRQEEILNAAGALCESLGVTKPAAGDYTVTALERPFLGVYYGQAALPMPAETLNILENDLLSQCVVTNLENGKTGGIYDMDKLTSRDLYDVYLSGAVSLLEIENPNAKTDKELIVFRDSFGSSMIPLLIADYAHITVIDIRYVASNMLDRFVDFHGQDVLMLYSTLVLNSSATLK